MAIKVAVFEDNYLLCEGLYHLIHASENFVCTGAFHDCSDLKHKINQSEPDIILMDDAYHGGPHIARYAGEPAKGAKGIRAARCRAARCPARVNEPNQTHTLALLPCHNTRPSRASTTRTESPATGAPSRSVW